MTFFEFMEKYNTEDKVVKHYINIRYGNKVTCNHCGSEKVYHRKSNRKVFDCNACDNTFSIFKDTIFEKSSTDLRKWFYAIHLFLNGKKGISAKQLEREIGVTYKTAWRMLHKIREAMGNKKNEQFIETILEIDETYVGGKPRKGKDKDNDDKPKRGRGTKKTPVVGIVDRNSKKVHAKVALPNKQGQKLSGNQLLTILNEVCEKSSKNIIMTDEFKGYNILDKKEYLRYVIDHTRMYADGNIHTNSIESFWAILKRAVYGIYHHVSKKYLQNYINEFCFRFNNRDKSSFDLILKQSVLLKVR